MRISSAVYKSYYRIAPNFSAVSSIISRGPPSVVSDSVHRYPLSSNRMISALPATANNLGCATNCDAQILRKVITSYVQPFSQSVACQFL